MRQSSRHYIPHDGCLQAAHLVANYPGCAPRVPQFADLGADYDFPPISNRAFPSSATMVVFDSRVIPPPPAPHVKVPVEFLVNPNTIAGEEMKDGGRHFGLESHVAAYSLDGADCHVDQGLDATVKGDRLQAHLQQGIPFRAVLPMTPGQHRLRLAVRDMHTGFMGTTEIPLNLAAKQRQTTK